MKLRPSLSALMLPNGHPSRTSDAELTREQFQAVVRDIGMLMEHASILEPEELDHLGMTYLNLNAAATVFRTQTLHPDSAKNTLALIDTTMVLFEAHDLTTTKLGKPWERSNGGK